MGCLQPLKYNFSKFILGNDKDNQTKTLILSTDDRFTLDMVYGHRMSKNIDIEDARWEAILNRRFCIYKILFHHIP